MVKKKLTYLPPVAEPFETNWALNLLNSLSLGGSFDDYIDEDPDEDWGEWVPYPEP